MRRQLEMLLLKTWRVHKRPVEKKVTCVSSFPCSVLFTVLLVLIAGFVTLPAASATPVTCNNAPGGGLGNCVDVARCSIFMVELNSSRPLRSGTLELLGQTHCGFHHKQPMVCCPPSAVSTPSPANRENATVLSRVKELENETVQQGLSSNVTVQSPSETMEHPNLSLLPVEFCGYSVSDRIYRPPNVLGLSDVRPDVVRLQYTTRSGPRFLCGGSLISSRYVLTAAHCITALPSHVSLSAVLLGEFDVRTDPDCNNEGGMEWCMPAVKRVVVQSAIPHPDYSVATRRHDIALIRLDEEVEVTEVDDYNVVCLPLNIFHYPLPVGSDLMETAGWGTTMNGSMVTKERKYGIFHRLDRDQCRSLYRNSTPFVDSHICATGKTNVDPTLGDTGGPIMVIGRGEGQVEFLNGPLYVQIGVESFTPPAASRRHLPSLFTKVKPYLTWILDTLKP